MVGCSLAAATTATGSDAGTQYNSRNRTPQLTTVCHLSRIGVSFDYCFTSSATFLS
jgi:hypothetical protein